MIVIVYIIIIIIIITTFINIILIIIIIILIIIGTRSTPSLYLNQCLNILNWTLRSKYQWILVEIYIFHSRKCMWICRLRNDSHFVAALCVNDPIQNSTHSPYKFAEKTLTPISIFKYRNVRLKLRRSVLPSSWGLPFTVKYLIWYAPNPKTWMILVSSCICLCPIYWSQVLSRERRCSWSSADRRCSNYIWVINNLIAY